MKIFGFSRNGFLYIDNGDNLISQQTTSSESQMLNDYSSIQEYGNFTSANFAYHKPKLEKMFAGSDWLEKEENQLW
jgi:hypothetical protein